DAATLLPRVLAWVIPQVIVWMDMRAPVSCPPLICIPTPGSGSPGRKLTQLVVPGMPAGLQFDPEPVVQDVPPALPQFFSCPGAGGGTASARAAPQTSPGMMSRRADMTIPSRRCSPLPLELGT